MKSCQVHSWNYLIQHFAVEILFIYNSFLNSIIVLHFEFVYRFTSAFAHITIIL